jgi:hypothetical protein
MALFAVNYDSVNLGGGEGKGKGMGDIKGKQPL